MVNMVMHVMGGTVFFVLAKVFDYGGRLELG